MKKVVILSLIFFVSVVSFNSCTTYEEGPDIALLPVNVRIKGTWDQTKLYVNGTENTDITYEFTFNSDGTGTRFQQWSFINETKDIDWKFSDDKTLLMIKNTEDTEWSEATILRLTNSELWIMVDAGVFGMWEIHYEKV